MNMIYIYRAKKHAQVLSYSGSASDSDVAESFLLLSSKLESHQVVLSYSFTMPECEQALTKCLDASVKQADTRAIERVDRQSA